MRRIVTIDDATGNVVATWMGGAEQGITAPAGQTTIDVTASGDASFTGMRWNGAAFEAIPPTPVDPLDVQMTPRELRTALSGIKADVEFVRGRV